MMNVSSDYIYDDAILNRPCLSERNGKIENGEKRANAARIPDRLLCDGRSQRHEVNAIRWRRDWPGV